MAPTPVLFDGSFIGQIVRRRVPVIGDGNGWWSFLHIDDAATATALAIERGEAANIYNIVDDEPAPVREWLPALSAMLGAKPPRRVPAWLGRLVAGEHLVVMMTQVRGARMRRLSENLDGSRRIRRGGRALLRSFVSAAPPLTSEQPLLSGSWNVLSGLPRGMLAVTPAWSKYITKRTRSLRRRKLLRCARGRNRCRDSPLRGVSC